MDSVYDGQFLPTLNVILLNGFIAENAIKENITSEVKDDLIDAIPNLSPKVSHLKYVEDKFKIRIFFLTLHKGQII